VFERSAGTAKAVPGSYAARRADAADAAAASAAAHVPAMQSSLATSAAGEGQAAPPVDDAARLASIGERHRALAGLQATFVDEFVAARRARKHGDLSVREAAGRE
jgi:hypothetical protein